MRSRVDVKRTCRSAENSVCSCVRPLTIGKNIDGFDQPAVPFNKRLSDEQTLRLPTINITGATGLEYHRVLMDAVMDRGTHGA